MGLPLLLKVARGSSATKMTSVGMLRAHLYGLSPAIVKGCIALVWIELCKLYTTLEYSF